MTRVELLSIAMCAIILAISTEQAFALVCWSCNNLVKFCDDPFDSSKLSGAERLSLIDCNDGLCVKAIANVSVAHQFIGQPVLSVSRFCMSTPESAEQYCKDKSLSFCETCDSDECNGSAQYAPIALMLTIPIVITKIFVS